MERIETVIVGGGQAGLATSYCLKQHGREHIVLEQAAQAASAWRNKRWDSFTLVTPNWTLMLPGAEYNAADRDSFMPRDRIVAYFEQYAERFQLPIQYNTRVLSVEPLDRAGYRIQTSGQAFTANNVVIATGYEQIPYVPPFTDGFSPGVTQLHTSMYRNPGSIPDGAVLVVGSAQSGCQIAEELYQNGRQVFLATCKTGRMPRRYRGKDAFEWLYLTGFFETTPDRLPFPKERFSPPHLTGARGGHTINLHQFARDGVTLLGHLRGASDDRVYLAPDLQENLAKADTFEQEKLTMIDSYIQTAGLNSPPEELPRLRDGFDQPIIKELDLKEAGIHTVIWATGYTFNYSLVKMPVFEENGFPIQSNGVSKYPGLAFAGMPWMPSLKTGILVGVGDSARRIANFITEGVAQP